MAELILIIVANNKKNTVTKSKGFVTKLTNENLQDLPALEIEGSVNIVNGNYLVDGIPLSGSGGGPVVLNGDVSGSALTNTIRSIQGNPVDLSGIVNGNILGFESGIIVPVTSSGNAPVFLDGDVSGSAISNIINYIQGNLIDLSGISEGDLLVFNSGKIVPSAGTPGALPSGFESVLYVDSLRGDDLTGVRGNDQYPFEFVSGAVGSALPNDLIFIGPGNNAGVSSVTKNLSFAGQGIDITSLNGPGGSITIDSSDSIILQDLTLTNGGERALNVSAPSAIVALRNVRFERFGFPGNVASFENCTSVFENNVQISIGNVSYTDCTNIRVVNSFNPGNDKRTIIANSANTIAEFKSSQLGDVEWQGSSPSACYFLEGTRAFSFNGSFSGQVVLQGLAASFEGTVTTGNDYGMAMDGCIVRGDLILGNCSGPTNMSFKNGSIAGSIVVGSNIVLDLRGTNFDQNNLSIDPTASVIRDDNFTAITNPSVNDDLSFGWRVGSKWINVSNSKIFTCVDASLGAAIWVESLTQFNISRSVLVDSIFGNDGTAQLNDFSKPFETVQAAVNAVASSSDPEPYTIFLPSFIEESVTLPALTAAPFFIFCSFSENTNWYGSVGIPAVSVGMGGGSAIFHNILLSGKSAEAISAQGTGVETIGLRNCGIERDGNPSDIAGNFNNIAVFYDNTSINAGAYLHVDCPIVVYITSKTPDALGYFRVSGTSAPSFFVSTIGVFTNLELEGDIVSFMLPEVSIVGSLQTQNLVASSAINFSGFANTTNFQAEGSLDISRAKLNELIIGSTAFPWTANAKKVEVLNAISIGDNVIVDADGCWFKQNNISLGANSEILGWNRFNFGGVKNSWFDPTQSYPGQGETGNLAAPHETLQDAINFTSGGEIVNILPGQVIASPNIVTTDFSIKGSSRDRTTWIADTADACMLVPGSNVSIENITINGNLYTAVSSLACTLNLNDVFLTGNQSLNLANSTLTSRASTFDTEVRLLDTNAEFNSCEIKNSIYFDASVGPYVISLNNCIGNANTNILATGSCTVKMKKGTSLGTLDLSAWTDAYGPQTVEVYGLLENAIIAGISGAELIFNGATISNSLTFDNYTGNFSVSNFQNATIDNVDARSSSIGPVTIDLSFSNVRGAILIGNDITLDLTGATYNPDNIVLSGNGRYVDYLNPRTRIPSVVSGVDYDVQPRDALVQVDNNAGLANVNLNMALESCGTLVVAALADPALTYPVNIIPFAGDTIEGNASYVIDGPEKVRVTLIADKINSVWRIIDVYPGAAAPASPLPFPEESGTTYTLTTSVSGVVMTNTGGRQVTLPASVSDGIEFVIVDGAGTASINSIEIISSSPILGVVGNDYITSDFASVTYRFSAALNAWSRI